MSAVVFPFGLFFMLAVIKAMGTTSWRNEP